jgi:hypothetical protein
MNDILDAIAEIHDAGSTRALPLLRQVVPVVDQITTFTDGDETDWCRIELIETTARVAPGKLPNFYAHHLEDDEFRYADKVLEQHFKISKPDSPVTQALAKTFVEEASISLLTEMAAKSPALNRVLDEQLAFTGGRPTKKEYDYGANRSGVGYFGTKKPPNVAKFKPSEFTKLISKLSDQKIGYDYQRTSARDWLLHWEKHGRGRQALKSIQDFFEEEEGTHIAEAVLDLAYDVSARLEGKKAAFYWLVQAHMHRHGWQSFWTAESEIMDRLKKAAENHRSDWKRFIFETSAQAKYWRQRGHSFSIGIKYLVRFLVLVDQRQLALDFTKSCVKIVLDEVSDQPLPDCPWFN